MWIVDVMLFANVYEILPESMIACQSCIVCWGKWLESDNCPTANVTSMNL